MALFDKFEIENGEFHAYCEGPIGALNTIVPDNNRWSKRIVWNNETKQDDYLDRTVDEYIDYYYISTDKTKVLIHLRAQNQDPYIMSDLTYDELGLWNAELAKLGFTLNSWKTQAEVDALIADGTYESKYRIGEYEG